MLSFEARTGSFVAEIWWDTNPLLNVSQDGWLLTELPGGRLRAAVLDGITPVVEGTWRLGLDQAVWAAQTTRAALHADQPIATCLEAAHAEVFDPEIMPPRRRPQTGVVCCDLNQDGSGEVVVAYDCEAWIRTGESWRELPGTDMLIPEARAAFTELVGRKAELTREAFNAAETELLGPQEMWTRHGVGQYRDLAFVSEQVRRWDEIVLATDGALLDQERVSRLPEWLAGLRTWEAEQAATLKRFKKSDDVAVVRIRRA